MPVIEIKSRRNADNVLYATEAESLREAVEKACAADISLEEADLRMLAHEDLTGAVFDNGYFRNACISGDVTVASLHKAQGLIKHISTLQAISFRGIVAGTSDPVLLSNRTHLVVKVQHIIKCLEKAQVLDGLIAHAKEIGLIDTESSDESSVIELHRYLCGSEPEAHASQNTDVGEGVDDG